MKYRILYLFLSFNNFSLHISIKKHIFMNMRQMVFFIFWIIMSSAWCQTMPEAHRLAESPYFFSFWDAESNPGTYPENMAFQIFSDAQEPKKSSMPISDWNCYYNLDNKSRFVGLGDDGIGFINTSDVQEAESCLPNSIIGKVGAVVLAVNTEGITEVELSWKIRLIKQGDGYPFPREFHLEAEYSIGQSNAWESFPASLVYSSKEKEDGEVKSFALILPEECENQEYVLIRWRYYQTEEMSGGKRPLIGLDDIKVYGQRTDGDNKPFVFFDKDYVEEFGCVEGHFSALDSIIFSAVDLKEDLSITTSGSFYFSLSKTNDFKQELILKPSKGVLGETVIYVKKECLDLSTEKKQLNLNSGTINYIVGLSGRGYSQIYINETVSSNFMCYYDSKTDGYPDWIELYNPNDELVHTGTWFLSDDKENLTKNKIRAFPGTNIQPQGFLMFKASGDSSPSVTHLDFKLSAHGETVFLTAPDGKTIVDSVTIPKLETDVSYGRLTDGSSQWVKFSISTPEVSNNVATVYKEKSAPPKFSHLGGYYEEPFLLHLNSENPDAKIYYTLDGSDPDPKNLGGAVYEYKQSYTKQYKDTPFYGESYFRPYRTFLYYNGVDLSLIRGKYFWLGDINAEPTLNPFVPKSKRDFGSIVRAVCLDPDKGLSDIITHTYFFKNSDTIPNKLPVISIVINEKDFKGFYEGIAVPGVDYENWRNTSDLLYAFFRPGNYHRRGRENEIPANFEILFDDSSVVNQLVGLRIHGNSSRQSKHKAYRLYTRKFYGKDRIVFPFFKNLAYDDYSRLMLRASGQDVKNTFFRDAFIQRLLSFSTVDYQEYQPFNIYINGEYYGLRNARERLDENYIYRKYGVNSQEIDYIKLATVKYGDKNHYNLISSFLEDNDLSLDKNFLKLNTMMDIGNFIDYNLIKIYSAVVDWPNNNIRYWRYKSDEYNPHAPYGLDGRWRWMNFDDDSGFLLDQLHFNSLEKAAMLYRPGDTIQDNEWWATFFFRNLLESNQFKTQLITRYSDLLNTAFLPHRVISLIDQFKNLIEHDIQNHITRWGAFPRTGIEGWHSEVEGLKEFALQRHPIVYDHIRDFFKLSNTVQVDLDVNDYDMGHIKINTIEIEKKTPGVDTNKVYPWNGKYFVNLPISFIAVPHDGHKFSHWELPDSISYLDTLVFDLKGQISVKAYFEIDENYVYDPEPAIISDCPYEFNHWHRKQNLGDMPDNMAFYYTRFPDSKPNGAIDGQLDSIRYDHSTKTRITGMGQYGIALINTNGANKNYYQTRLGAVAVAFKTEDIRAAEVSFTLGTVLPKSKKYSIRLQYRFSDKGEVFDFYDNQGNLVEYHGSMEEWQEHRFENIELPKSFMGRKYVQLIWRYYYNGQQVDMGSDARDELRIDDIVIRQKNIIGIESDKMYESTLLGNPNGIDFQWYSCTQDSLVLIDGATDRNLTISHPGYYSVDISYENCRQFSECEYYYVKEHKEYAYSLQAAVYPNPSDGIFNLTFDETLKDFEVSLMDVTGKIIDVRSLSEAKNVQYDMRKLTAGVYLINIALIDGRKTTQKVIIQ